MISCSVTPFLLLSIVGTHGRLCRNTRPCVPTRPYVPIHLYRIGFNVEHTEKERERLVFMVERIDFNI